MYYFSLESIVSAFHELKGRIPSKFVGLLSILKSIDADTLIPNSTYRIPDEKIGNWLNYVMSLENTLPISSSSALYVRFSVEWDNYISENIFVERPNIFPLLVFIYKFTPFKTSPLPEELLQRFESDFHLSEAIISKWFCQGPVSLSFQSECVKRETIKEALNLPYSTLTFEGSSSVKAKASELSRAPFIQTLYAGMDNMRCLLVSRTNLEALYPSNGQSFMSNQNVQTPLQVIYYGAPGTGKSYKIKNIDKGQGTKPVRTTFHPDSDYATFVGAYKPTMEVVPRYESSGTQVVEKRIVYNFMPQAFLKAYVQAWANYPEPQYLVIEEINRGNCAQIFGDLFQLLDRSATGFSEYPIAADSDISKYLSETFATEANFALDESAQSEINELYKDEYTDVMGDVRSGELLLLPKNLHILATMNTSDQSLFPIDSAFKRRWDWEYIPIRNANKGWVITTSGKEWDWWTFLQCINEKIGSVTDSEDKKLGYFFVKPSDNHSISAETFVSKVIFYLWNDVFKDYGFSDKEFQTESGSEMTFPMFYETDTEGQQVNEGLVAQFLQNVAGEPLQDNNSEQESEESTGV